MTILTYDDLIPILVVNVAFALIATAHRVLLPQMYSSILLFKYTGDYRRTAKSSAIRVLYVLLLTLFFYKIVNYTSHQIYFGIFIACFLNVWPAIIQFHLLSFWKSKAKSLILLGYISFIALSVFMAYISINMVSPMLFDNKEYAIFDNSGWNIIKTIILFIIPVSFEGILAKYSSTIKGIDIDTFLEEVRILKSQLEVENDILNSYKYEIERICNENGIDVMLLKTIVNLEYIFRGRWYIWLGELLVCKVFPKIAIKKDLSVGLTQIRISTAKDVLRMAPNKFVKNLIEPEFNMNVCAELLKQIIYDYEVSQDDYMVKEVEDIYEYISLRYLCEGYEKDNKTVLLYGAILRSEVPELKEIKNIYQGF